MVHIIAGLVAALTWSDSLRRLTFLHRTERPVPKRPGASSTRIALVAALATVLVSAAFPLAARMAPTAAGAAPITSAEGSFPSPTAREGFVRLGSDRASLTSTSSAIVAGDAFGYKAIVRTSSAADGVTVRFKLWRPTGRLIFQRTKTFSGVEKSTTLEAEFSRATDDLTLRPGAYPVELEVTVRRDGKSQSATISTRMYVLDDERTIPTALVIRVNGQPLADPNGVFVNDPADYTRARDDLNAITAWILEDRGARCTVAVSPLLLEEWQRISGGYKLVAPEGNVQVASNGDVPLAYSAAMSQLRAALDTGRLELTSQGYADPDLSDLQGADLLSDVTQQYQHGVSALFSSLEATASTGTVPASGWLPPAAVPLLADSGIRYAVVSPASARAGSRPAKSSAYRSSAKGIVILVADDALSNAIESGDTSVSTSLTFDRLLEDAASGPLVISADVGSGAAPASTVIRTFSDVSALPWIKTHMAREVARAPKKRTVRLRPGQGTEGDPPGYWDDVREGRMWSDALIAAAGDDSAEAVTAHRDSMIAQCSAWAGSDEAWALEHRGRTFAATAKRLSTDVLNKVSLDAKPVTLAGTSGKVPVTVSNASDRTLMVYLTVTSDQGVRLAGATRHAMRLGPQDTFIEVPVELANVLSGDVHVVLSAGQATLDSATVTVTASYLDRIALILGVIVAMVGLLVFIIKRVSKAEQGWATAANDRPYVADDAEAYTGQTSFEELWRNGHEESNRHPADARDRGSDSE